jgi:hypothetical protein
VSIELAPLVTRSGGAAYLQGVRVALALVMFLLVGCASKAQPEATSTIAPPDPPQQSAGGPPPAWIETAAGSRWLGHSTYCWVTHTPNGATGTCADAIEPTCDQPQVPKVTVELGETVRAHLGFSPVEASLLRGTASGALLRGTTLEWRVKGAGPFVVFARAEDGKDASYAGCAVFG